MLLYQGGSPAGAGRGTRVRPPSCAKMGIGGEIMTNRGRKTPSKLGKAVTSNMVPTKDQIGDRREREYIMSYFGLAVALAGFLVISWGNWGKSLEDSAAIVGMFVVIAYFILCSISIRLRKKCKARWIQWLSEVAKRTEFGYLSLSLGLFALGISLLQRGYPWGVRTGMLLIITGYVVLIWGSTRQPATTRRGNTD